jgi:hypothetical protein
MMATMGERAGQGTRDIGKTTRLGEADDLGRRDENVEGVRIRHDRDAFMQNSCWRSL